MPQVVRFAHTILLIWVLEGSFWRNASYTLTLLTSVSSYASNVEPYRRRGWSCCWFEFVELMPVGSGDLFDSLVSERPQDQRMQSAGSQSVGVSDSETLCRQGTNGLHLYSVAMRLRHQGIASGLVEFTTREYCPDSSINSVWSVSSQMRTILQLHYDCAIKAAP